MPEHNTEPSLEQWKDLYEVARNIRLIAPWNTLNEMNLITIMLPGREEPVYCSVIGQGGECYGVGVYPGYESVNDFYRLADAGDDEMCFLAGFEQNCMMCYFGDREELSNKEREILKSLNIRFRGRNEWIYFRAIEPGYFPWTIDSEQADLLISTLQNFAMACTYLLNNKLTVDFDGGETLLRYYSPEKELWLNQAVKMPPIPVITQRLIADDETLLAKLKRKKRSGVRLEFEATYLPVPIQENKNDKPYLARVLLLMDKGSGLVLGQHMAGKDDQIEMDILDMLTQYILKSGRPASINVRDDHTGRYIEDFCQKIDVEMIEGEGVPAVDRALGGMLNFLG